MKQIQVYNMGQRYERIESFHIVDLQGLSPDIITINTNYLESCMGCPWNPEILNILQMETNSP